MFSRRVPGKPNRHIHESQTERECTTPHQLTQHFLDLLWNPEIESVCFEYYSLSEAPELKNLNSVIVTKFMCPLLNLKKNERH